MKGKALIMLWSLAAVGVIFFLLLYFSADIIDKGLTLNRLTPWNHAAWWAPYCGLGTVMWGGIILLVWLLFINPIFAFCRLVFGGTTTRKRIKNALKVLKKERGKATAEGSLYAELHNALMKRDNQEMLASLEKYEQCGVIPQTARKIILSYASRGGIGLVICSNHIIDGLILLGIQMCLMAELARLYGYRCISPVFLLLCLGWVLLTSILHALFAEDFETMIGEGSGELIEALLGQAVTTGIISKASKLAAEFLIGWINIYLSGRIFMALLTHEMNKGNLEKISAYRIEAYKQFATSESGKVLKAVVKGAFKMAKSWLSFGEKDDDDVKVHDLSQN